MKMEERHSMEERHPLVKICGLQTEADIAIVNSVLPDYVGFVFAASKRRISMETAEHLRAKLDRRVQSVGVFVDEELERIQELCAAKIIDVVQLHGNEDLLYIERLKEKINCQLIKAVRVQTRQDIVDALKLPVDYLLLDTFVKGEQGGSGQVFNWEHIPDMNRDFFLAGGLQPQNVSAAIAKTRPYGVDVSSGVETNGSKDVDKIREFVSRVRKEQ